MIHSATKFRTLSIDVSATAQSAIHCRSQHVLDRHRLESGARRDRSSFRRRLAG
jgi:hypothetical protein